MIKSLKDRVTDSGRRDKFWKGAGGMECAHIIVRLHGMGWRMPTRSAANAKAGPVRLNPDDTPCSQKM